ncbi:MAG: DUF1269 domain-containing protein [Caldilineaceae bacterium]|nr:DUF1269 domain-containing protein [Caldilineaceae bacterium]
MYELMVVGFKKDMFRASTVLNKLIDLKVAWVVDLQDGVAVYRDYSGRLRIDQSYRMTTGEGAAWGALWGTLIGGLLAVPFTAGASAAVAAGAIAAGVVGGGAIGALGGAIDADWWKDEIGISEKFVAEVGALIEPGDSAIFALVRTYDPEYVAEQFRGYGGTVLRSSLTQEQSAKVQAMLEGSRSAA